MREKDRQEPFRVKPIGDGYVYDAGGRRNLTTGEYVEMDPLDAMRALTLKSDEAFQIAIRVTAKRKKAQMLDAIPQAFASTPFHSSRHWARPWTWIAYIPGFKSAHAWLGQILMGSDCMSDEDITRWFEASGLTFQTDQLKHWYDCPR